MLIQDMCSDQVKKYAASESCQACYKARAAGLFRELADPVSMYSSIVKPLHHRFETEEDLINAFRDFVLLVGFMAVVDHVERHGLDEQFFDEQFFRTGRTVDPFIERRDQ